MSNARTAKNQAATARGSHLARRQDQERADDEGTALSMEERLAMIRNEFVQEALPTAPDIPGFHMCWLSTTHSYDTIHRRMRLGYELVRRDELPGFVVQKTSSGDYADYIMCNEMILAKIPVELYQAIMREFHHDRPLAEEEAINARIEQFTQQDTRGKDLTIRDEGMEERALVRRAPAPDFH